MNGDVENIRQYLITRSARLVLERRKFIKLKNQRDKVFRLKGRIDELNFILGLISDDSN